VLRGLLRRGTEVRKGSKLGEIDPVANREVCFTIRPKTRAISGGVLETILAHFNT
jgi:xanthine dehydrogenase accessory factor